MSGPKGTGPMFLLLITFLWCSMVLCDIMNPTFKDAEEVYSWTDLDFDWPTPTARTQAYTDGSYKKDKNLLAGIKVYKDTVYVTIPRWRGYTGFPVTLATVVKSSHKVNNELRPYPDWESQKIGDCNALQYAQSMEIDPNTGLMYVIDTGRIGLSSPNITPKNLCPAKIVIYDLNTNKLVASHDLPDDKVSRSANYVNDIVLDYIDGKVRYAYMSDVLTGQLHIFDFRTNRTRNLVDPVSMNAEVATGGNIITINGVDYDFTAHLDGIAMSPNFDYVYYCTIGGYDLYSVPTSTLRSGGSNGIRKVGKKISQTDGMVFGRKRLYYGALGLNAVYYWDPEMDMRNQGASINDVKLETEVKLSRNDKSMQWPDTFALDEQGWLWVVANRLHLFMSDTMDFSGSEINMGIWKVYVNDTSYLHDAPARTSYSDEIIG